MTEDPRNLSSKLNLETAKAPWRELQTFFAQGSVLHVSPSLDLLNVAQQVSEDNASLFGQWLSAGSVKKVSDEQALTWFNNDSSLWTVVIKPWILVQEIN